MPNLAINGGPKLREKDFTPWTQYTEEDQKGLQRLVNILEQRCTFHQ